MITAWAPGAAWDIVQNKLPSLRQQVRETLDQQTASIMHVRLQEPRQAVEVGVGLDVADHGDQGRRVD